jgi:hypothetical protein
MKINQYMFRQYFKWQKINQVTRHRIFPAEEEKEIEEVNKDIEMKENEDLSELNAIGERSHEKKRDKSPDKQQLFSSGGSGSISESEQTPPKAPSN